MHRYIGKLNAPVFFCFVFLFYYGVHICYFVHYILHGAFRYVDEGEGKGGKGGRVFSGEIREGRGMGG